eukprot:Amastigsp_a843972_21.p2 type:complete len:192 gc:universal Amastigsp_a843972_21:1266-691(-)
MRRSIRSKKLRNELPQKLREQMQKLCEQKQRLQGANEKLRVPHAQRKNWRSRSFVARLTTRLWPRCKGSLLRRCFARTRASLCVFANFSHTLRLVTAPSLPTVVPPGWGSTRRATRSTTLQRTTCPRLARCSPNPTSFRAFVAVPWPARSPSRRFTGPLPRYRCRLRLWFRLCGPRARSLRSLRKPLTRSR